ncbi:MAG: STT3 domain-containing protein [Candidatus Woesearchaeota archaeon]
MDQEDLIRSREKKIKEFLLCKRAWIQYILLAIIIWIGTNIRIKPLKTLIDATTGKYITLELDSTLWLRYAKEIIEKGHLFQIDPMKSAPFGADIGFLGKFTAYFVAYLYKILNFFSNSVTLEYTDIIYPIIATALLSIFLFLLVRRLFDWRIGLLSVFLINIMPSFLFRSLGGSSDHDILGMMFLVMVFYFFVVAWQSKTIKFSIFFGVLAGLMTVLGFLTAGLITFAFLIIGFFFLVELSLEKFKKKDYYLLLSWLGIATILLTVVLKKLSFMTFLNSLTTLPAFFVFLASTFYLFILQKNVMKIKDKVNFPSGLFSIVFMGGFLLILGFIFMGGVDFLIGKYSQVTAQLFESFQGSRWVTTVAENHKPFVTDWFGQMGKLYVYSLVIGSIFLFYEAIKKIKRAKTMSVLYGLFIFSFVFSKYSGNSILNGSTTISKLMLVGSLVIFISIIAFLLLKSFYKEKTTFNQIRGIDKKYIFIFIWFLLMVLAATSAIRLLFEFTPVTAVVVSFFVFYLIDLAWKQSNKYIKYLGIILILFLLLNPFAFAKGIIPTYYKNSLGQANGTGPGYNSLWQQAGKWVRENTPENSVFAHWWDYGYWVQSGFERPTITDGGNFIGWWNFLMGRYVLTGNSTEEALKFLYLHNASYVLIVSDEIGKYPAYSLIGSDENLDRFSSVPLFSLDPSATQETREETLLLFRGGVALDKNLIYNGKLYPAGGAGIAGFILPIQQSNDSISVKQPQAILVYQGQQVNVPLRCLYFLDNKQIFEGDSFDVCLKIIPTIQDNQMNQLGAAVYLSEKVKDSFFAKAYIGNEEIQGFELVYDSEGQVPLAIYNGRLFGPIRIWKINYPKDLIITNSERDYYLREYYPDVRLSQNN